MALEEHFVAVDLPMGKLVQVDAVHAGHGAGSGTIQNGRGDVDQAGGLVAAVSGLEGAGQPDEERDVGGALVH